MIGLSIASRQAVSKLTLPALVAASFLLMLLGKADTMLAERARIGVADALAPIYLSISQPLAGIRSGLLEIQDLLSLQAENARLRAENDRLRRWQAVALALDAENRRLRANLHWIPDAAPSFVTARVVADAGGVYGRAVLLSTGPNHAISKGEIALDEHGLVGRVTEVGDRSARVVLITDVSSRIPVILGDSRGHAILAGTNGPRPRLMYWPDGAPPVEGETVLTSAEADALPANLPVGTVHYGINHIPEVRPVAELDRLELVRIFDYGLRGLDAPEAARRPVVADRRG